MLSAGLSSISFRPNSGLKQNPNDIREATTQQRELDMFPEAVVASDDFKPQLDVTKNKMVSHQYLILVIKKKKKKINISYYSYYYMLFVSFFRFFTLY